METALAAEVKHHALGVLGFDLVGIAPAEPPESAQRFLAWLADGRHGDMDYMAAASDVRLDPRRFLPGARAIVSVALSYHEEPRGSSDLGPPPGHALVGRYARRKDYHDVLRRRLLRLGAFLRRRRPESSFRVAVDSAPVLEKAAAARAGLGWIGRNTCLINRTFGSELFLGELVTTAALATDRQGSAHCGRCRACIEACPTQALVAPYELDARRCISYLTVEHRAAMPEALAPRITPYLAGCDICQLVCPWNERAAPRRDPSLASRPALQSLPIAVLADLREEGWRALRAGSPLRRLTYEMFRRNLDALSAAERETETGP